MFNNTSTVKYLDDTILLECTRGDRLQVKSAVFPKRRNIISRYFNIPLRRVTNYVEGDFKNFINIQNDKITFTPTTTPFVKTSTNISIMVGGKRSNHGWKVPSVIYKTDRHVLIAPVQSQFTASKIIYTIGGIATLLFSLILLVFSFLFGPIFFVLSLAFLVTPILSLYLFFFKKSYISVAPLDAIKSVNELEQTITIEGVFDTGVPSFLKRLVSAELYVGDNIINFMNTR